MKRSSLFKIFLGLAILIAALIVYQLVFVSGDEGEELGLDAVSGETGEGEADEFLDILLSLQQINLSAAVLTNPIFASLVDFSTELQPQTPGRSNPFAPIGVGGPPRLDETGRSIDQDTGTSTPES